MAGGPGRRSASAVWRRPLRGLWQRRPGSGRGPSRLRRVSRARTWQPCGHAISNGRSRADGFQHGSAVGGAGHDCVAYDLDREAIKASEADGARGAGTPQQVVDALTMPRHIWLMVPAAYVGSTIEAFAPLLSPGDTLIDGGNSWYHDDVDRAAPLRDRNINYLDVGTSGGVFGLD